MRLVHQILVTENAYRQLGRFVPSGLSANVVVEIPRET